MAMTDKLPAPEIKKERDQSTGSTSEQKAAIKGNAELMRRAREVNQYDLRLYAKGKLVYCVLLCLALWLLHLHCVQKGWIFRTRIVCSGCVALTSRFSHTSPTAVELFCATLQKYPALVDRVAAGNRVKCA
jgi:hypothetical protein